MNLSDLSPFQYYLAGVVGSISAELIGLGKEMKENGGHWPDLYKQPPFLIVKTLFTFVVAGSAPYFFDVNSITAAFYLGVTAPIVLERLLRGPGGPHLPPPSGGSGHV